MCFYLLFFACTNGGGFFLFVCFVFSFFFFLQFEGFWQPCVKPFVEDSCVFCLCSSVMLACDFLFFCDIFVWFWYQGDGGLVKWTWTHVNAWLIHVNVWQKPLQHCKVTSLQIIKINEKKKKKKKYSFPCNSLKAFQKDRC